MGGKTQKISELHKTLQIKLAYIFGGFLLIIAEGM